MSVENMRGLPPSVLTSYTWQVRPPAKIFDFAEGISAAEKST